MGDPKIDKDSIVPVFWVEGMRDLLKQALLLNGAIVIALPTILHMTTNRTVVLNAIFSVAIAGVLCAVAGLLLLGTQAYAEEPGIPNSRYGIARNAAWTGLSIGSMALIAIGLGIFTKSGAPHWAFWVPILGAPAG